VVGDVTLVYRGDRLRLLRLSPERPVGAPSTLILLGPLEAVGPGWQRRMSRARAEAIARDNLLFEVKEND
jgi:hypothetical protein